MIKQLKKIFGQRFFFQMIRMPIKKRIFRSEIGLDYLLNNYEFTSVLDIGSGSGEHSERFYNAGKKTVSIDYGKSPYFAANNHKHECIVDDFNRYKFTEKYDCIWASHVLEHQLNPNLFIRKMYDVLKPEGILAVTVPPMKPTIVGGHVNLYNPGLLLYQVILGGFNCYDAALLWYDYNITLIVCKDGEVDLSNLTYDNLDIAYLKKYFPRELQSRITTNFNGNISRINWHENNIKR